MCLLSEKMTQSLSRNLKFLSGVGRIPLTLIFTVPRKAQYTVDAQLLCFDWGDF